MPAMDFYEALKTFHVLAAVIWVGGNVYQHVVNTPKVRRADPAELKIIAGDSQNYGNRVLIPSTLVLIASGFAMTADADLSLGDFWLSFALAGWIFSFVLGAFYLGPTLGKVKQELTASGGHFTPAATEHIRKIFFWSRIELAILLLIVIDMVVKPGL